MGQLLFRVNVVVPEALLSKAVTLKSKDETVLRVGGAFIVVDGYLDSKEAALQEPYSDDPRNRGKMYLTGEALAAYTKKAMSFGVQPVIHAMGDTAIDTTLKVIEQVPKGNVRFRIEQAAVLNKTLIERLKKLNVVISIQPKVVSTEFTVWSADQRLGDRAKWLHPLKTLIDEGVVVAAGSDCPMEPLSALLGMQELMLREQYSEQRLSADEAIRLYTSNAACCSGEEGIKGSIEEGKLADFVVLAQDPAYVRPKEIKDIVVDFVVLNGKVLVVT
jgi:predicted amidohydrolase YtcJ